MPNALDHRGLPADYSLDAERETTPREVKARVDAGADLLLIDCRQPHEHDLVRLENSTLVPLPEREARFDDELAGQEGREVVVYCRSGMRSLTFVDFLRGRGFTNARSMAGGINLWNTDIQPGGLTY